MVSDEAHSYLLLKKIMTLPNVQKALDESRILQESWIAGGWDVVIESPIDIYPLIEQDISVNITIISTEKVYVAPLENVSDISVNDSLTISLNDLYFDWKERVLNNLGVLVNCYSTSQWKVFSYLGSDGKIRVVKEKV